MEALGGGLTWGAASFAGKHSRCCNAAKIAGNALEFDGFLVGLTFLKQEGIMAGHTITRAQLTEAVYQEVGLSRNESAELVESVIAEISDALGARRNGQNSPPLAVSRCGKRGSASGATEDRAGSADQPAPGSRVPRLARAEAPDQQRSQPAAGSARARAAARSERARRRRRPRERRRAGENTGTRRVGKSDTAFRTIGEVAGDPDIPAHVLRFWESKFSQLKPLKRGGGRRYYRPEDILLLRHIRQPVSGRLYDPRCPEAAAWRRCRRRRQRCRRRRYG